VLIAVLAVNAFSRDPQLWLIFVIAGFLTATSAMQRPSREALMPRTVRHDQLTAAQALISFGMQVGVLVGPAVGGLLIAYVGLRWCFVVDVVGLCLATVMYAAMGHYAHRAETTPPSLAGIKAGLDYALKRRDLLGTYFVDIAAMMLALPVVLFPALAKDVFEAPQYLGLLYSAETVGALLMTAFSGWTSRVHLHGRAIVIAAAAYGVTIALAGIAPSIWVAAIFLALSGAADMISGIFRGTVWNQTIPETMRGRLAGIEMLSYSLGPTAGQIRAGVVADAWTVRGSIASGGVACVVGVALTAAWLRDFWTYDDRTDEHALAEREVRQAAGE
jgi:MFS family permease